MLSFSLGPLMGLGLDLKTFNHNAMKHFTEKQVLDLLVKFNNQKGRYTNIDPKLIKKWMDDNT